MRKTLGVILLSALMLYLPFFFLPARFEQQKAADSFKPISAKVISGQAVYNRLTYGSCRRMSRSSSSCRKYQPYVVYQYTYNGASFRSDVYCFSCKGYNQDQTEQMVRQKYNPGQSITVYVDPDDPKRSIVSNEDANLKFYIFAMVIVWVVAGFSIFRLLRRPY